MDPTEVIFDFEMVGGVKEKLRQIKKVVELTFEHSRTLTIMNVQPTQFILLCQMNPAQLTFGRFNYRIWVGLPDPESHKLILQECTKNLPVLEKSFPTKLTDETLHLGGSLLRKIIEQAHKLAIKRSIGTGQPTEITTNDIEKAIKVCKKLKDSSEKNK
ncbi:unnamed protein product [Adineta steineri]|uniref:Uncharacterized protein n=1 Tax=Adineta steineri TaxID=433720 RepID=A0A815W3G4_9BILA|nr:unnamed protein product [Adineta steineri]CAF1655914.1 unnamed protein product [Adineta steineri]